MTRRGRRAGRNFRFLPLSAGPFIVIIMLGGAGCSARPQPLRQGHNMCISKQTSRDRTQQIIGLLRVARRDVTRLEGWENSAATVEKTDVALCKLSDAIKACQDLKATFDLPRRVDDMPETASISSDSATTVTADGVQVDGIDLTK